jgi:hypothetical protein
MFASQLQLVSPHLSPYHPYTSKIHVASPTSPRFHTPRSPIFLDAFHPAHLHSSRSADSTSDHNSSRKRPRPAINCGSSPGDPPFQRRYKRVRASTALSTVTFCPSNGINTKGTPHLPSIRSTALFTKMDTEMDTSRPETECPALNMLSSSSQRTASPPNLPPPLCMKRLNPKRLSLSLTMPTSSPSTLVATPSVITPTFYVPPSNESTPYTPGPPKTPALAMSLGRATAKGTRRPSLLSLITQPPTAYDDVPLTPGGNTSFAPGRAKIRARRSTTPEISTSFGYKSGPLSAQSSYQTFAPISEHESSFGQSYQSATSSTSPDTSPHSSESGSTSTTPASSPPLPPAGFASALLYGAKAAEPYEDGPIEIIPNVFLGAEDSARDLSWARRYRTLRIVNVAQEIDNPHGERSSEKKSLSTYCANDLTVEYCHLRWSHGESGLAAIPQGATLDELLDGSTADVNASSWGFWNAVKWLEEARFNGIPVLIQ